jgi:hypothetical protein
MYPHERSLVSKLSDKPFALLGVNSDQDRQALKKVLVEQQITWRSFWNGGGTGGPISRAWKVQGWPTLYLIDHKGVIRHKWLGAPSGPILDRAIDDLLKEAEKDEGNRGPAKRTAEKDEEYAAAQVRYAKKLIDGGDPKTAKERLQKVLKEYPDTKAAPEARELLDKLK